VHRYVSAEVCKHRYVYRYMANEVYKGLKVYARRSTSICICICTQKYGNIY